MVRGTVRSTTVTTTRVDVELSAPKRMPLVRGSRRDGLDRLRELLEKETMLDAWLADAGIEFLFDLARAKQIDAPSMVHISDAAATIAQMESEEKPLSTALIVGDPARIGRMLPESQIRLLRPVRRARVHQRAEPAGG